MTIQDKFPDNVQYSIQQYAAELHSQDMLDEIQHSYADKMLKQFHTQIIHKWLNTKLDTYGGYENLNEYLFHMSEPSVLTAYIRAFESCHCCKRHSYDGKIRKIPKPESYDDVYGLYHKKKCSCQCRHFRRKLLNVLNNY